MPAMAYRGLLREPGTIPVLAASIGARLGVGTFVIPLILTVQQATGSFASAGVVSAAFSVGVTGAAPVRGRLVDTFGARRALPPMAIVSALALAAIAVVAGDVPMALLVVLAAAAGMTTPPLVASMRLEWQRLLGVGDPRLTQAYALESAVQTASFVVGPLVAGLGIALVGAPSTLGASATILLVGTIVFAELARAAATPRDANAVSPIRRPGVRTLVLATALADVALGAIDVAATAIAEEAGRPGLAGLLLALSAVGALVGAFLYGLRSWDAPVWAQIAAIALATAAAVGLLAVSDALVVVGPLLLLAGVPTAAHWAASSIGLDVACGGRAGAEAFTWLTAANGVGIAAGSLVAGAASDAWGPSTAFLLASVGPAAAAAVVVAGRRSLTIERSRRGPGAGSTPAAA